MKLLLTVMVVTVVGCADQGPPCGLLPGHQEERDRTCTDSGSAQFYLSSSECDASYVTDTFKPAWCEAGCQPVQFEVGAGCAGATNPFYTADLCLNPTTKRMERCFNSNGELATVECLGTRISNGVAGCCKSVSREADSMSNDAVMFFACP
jgi:hypothetical protein